MIARRIVRRRIAVAVFAVAGLFVLACRAARAEEPDLTSAGTRDLTMTVGDADRTWRLHVPKRDNDKPVPLVIAIHGMMSNGKQQESLSGFTPLADKKGFAVAYPDGENRMWRYWNVGKGKEDFAFIEGIIDALVKAGTVDPRRVYATGISNGAYMSNALAVQLGDKIAAIAPVAGTFLRLGVNRQKPPHPMPVCYFHGTLDPVVGYDGTDMFSKTEASMGAEQLVAWWAEKNGCDKKPKIDDLEDKSEDDGTTVQRWTYAGTSPVVFYRVKGGGHTWPGMAPVGEKILGKTSKDIQASEIIWEFFEKYSLPEKDGQK